MQSKLQSAATEAYGSHQAIVTSLEGLPAGWKGQDASAFSGYMGKFQAASTELQTMIKNGQKSLQKLEDKLNKAIADIQKALDAAGEDYGRKLAKAKSQQKPGDPEPNEAQIANSAMQDHQADIDKALNEAEQAMQDISNELGLHVSNVGVKFTGIAAPDTSTYGPGQTSPVDYNNGGGNYYSGGSGSGGSGGGGGSTGGGGGGGVGGYGSSGPPPSTQVPGNVDQWIQQAEKVLESEGIHLTPDDINAIKIIIMHESGGNPHAINLTDSNAAAGHPSKGLMQCIDSTFSSNAAPGHNDIYNPVDNICAGVKYAIGRYGSMSNVPGVRAVAGGGSYVGY